MKIERHTTFKKSFKKRIAPNKKLVQRTNQRMKLFLVDPKNPTLKVHKLKGGKRTLHSFSVTGDIRIVYIRFSAEHIVLLDIGTHNQVY